MLNKIIKILNIVGSTLLVFCFVVFLLLRLNIIVEVKGVSMNDTYSEGELLFVLKSNLYIFWKENFNVEFFTWIYRRI